MPSYRLSYFDLRGRAEVLRLLFTVAGQEFEDRRLTQDEWAAIKPTTVFGQMPFLEVDGVMVAQTMAIATYLAREFGLHGKTNLESCQIDQVVCHISDFINATIKSMGGKDDEEKAKLMKTFTEEDCPKYLGPLENLLKQNQSGFFVGNSVTLADIAVYDFIWFLSGYAKDDLVNFPLVKAHLDKIGSMPRIKTYVENRKPTDH